MKIPDDMWIWAWNRDGVLVLTTVREMWEQYFEDHPEVIEEFRKAYEEPPCQ